MLEAVALEKAADYGIAGVFVAVLFMFYRKDVRNITEMWKAQSEMLVDVVRENTQAITANTEVTRSMHKRLDVVKSIR